MIKNTRVRIKGYGDCVVQQSRHHFEKGLIWFSFIPVDTNRLISTNDKSLIESSETPLYISWEEYGNPYWSITKGWLFKKRNWQGHYSLVEVMKHLRDNPGYKFKTRN